MDGFNHKKLGFSTSQLEILKKMGDSARHLSTWGAPKKAARSCHIHNWPHGAVTELCQGSILDLAEFLYAAGTQPHEGFIGIYTRVLCMLYYAMMWCDTMWYDMILIGRYFLAWSSGGQNYRKMARLKGRLRDIKPPSWKTKACFECPTRRGRPRTQYMIYISILKDEPDIFMLGMSSYFVGFSCSLMVQLWQKLGPPWVKKSTVINTLGVDMCWYMLILDHIWRYLKGNSTFFCK